MKDIKIIFQEAIEGKIDFAVRSASECDWLVFHYVREPILDSALMDSAVLEEIKRVFYDNNEKCYWTEDSFGG